MRAIIYFQACLFTFHVITELNILFIIAIAALPRHATATRTIIRASRAQRTSQQLLVHAPALCTSAHGGDIWSEPSVVCLSSSRVGTDQMDGLFVSCRYVLSMFSYYLYCFKPRDTWILMFPLWNWNCQSTYMELRQVDAWVACIMK